MAKTKKIKNYSPTENKFRIYEHRYFRVRPRSSFVRSADWSTRTLLITVPQYFTLAPYKSRTDLPYKHSKLAQLAKIRAVVCEDEIAVKSMPTSRYELWSFHFHFTSFLR